MNSSDDTTQFPSSRPLDGNLSVGEVFAEKYLIEAFISSGGMGSVYRAKHLLLNSTVALKVLNTTSYESPLTIRRFQQEAHAAFALNHPSLVRVFDLGVTSSGIPFLTMELVNGLTLSEFLKNQGTRTTDECALMMKQLCDGLQHAHDRGIIHRDIKPANIMLVDGQLSHLKILDFGIAKYGRKSSLKVAP